MSANIGGTSRPAGCVLVDAHVHFYPCYDREAFLAGALRNFERGAVQLGLPADTPGCLFLADCRGQDSLALLARRNGTSDRGPWELRAAREDGLLLSIGGGAPRLALIAGRQIVTRDGLEVLALGCTAGIPDGLALKDALAAAIGAGALTVLPWGFGKWRAGRGRLIRRVIDSADPSELFLGDNGGRAGLLGRPALFEWALTRGFAVLPGSDPLPFASQTGRAGGYGFCLEADVELACAAAQIKSALRNRAGGLEVFGTLENLWGFVRSQAAMKTRKCLEKARVASGLGNRIAVLSRGEK